MVEIDKAAMGRRVKKIRDAARLKQWELAQLLGTTQSAVHKYERGVVPEPRRLLSLARIGGTSVEWILTGRHWEGGSEDLERPDPELLETATRLRCLETVERSRVEEAIRLLRAAADAASPADPGSSDVVEAASRVHRAVIRRLLRDAEERLFDASDRTGPAHS